MNIYLKLTKEFNDGCLRAILSGGQAVVMHRVAFMSKDGDWVLREDKEAMSHVLCLLESYGATYRFGAPLDIRWMSGGWSAHFEFMSQNIRVRTDFVTRPPRLSPERIDRLWREQENRDIAFLDCADLIETKKTNREKDYAVIGELGRMLESIEDRLKYSRSARDLIKLAAQYPDKIAGLKEQRHVLAAIAEGIEAVEVALDKERRQLMHANERRIAAYMAAAEKWQAMWPAISRSLDGKPLSAAHREMIRHADDLLPVTVPGGLS
ncbi:MAG: hypothetical protein JW808_10680 [Victivallales bacterium]|nr:hypothetical protein [Victivallales bacterium]